MKRLVLASTVRIGPCVYRSYQERSMRWKHYRSLGSWAAFEGYKKIATVVPLGAEFVLEYTFSLGEKGRMSGGCLRATAQECRALFEEIYRGNGGKS